jgi:N-hydroxyarylamine O-acetyltransferase
MTYQPDLDAYFARIGYRGDRAPTVTTLQALSLAHVRSIPFENLDVLLGRGIDLDPVAVEHKLVHARRGGYCFEQNSLFLHVVRALGFDAQPLSARVRVGRTRDYTPARTHVFVRLEIDGESWLADVGVGASSLTSPLRLKLDVEQLTAHEPRRITALGDWHGWSQRDPNAVLFHQVRHGDTWSDVCEFTLEEMPEIDRVVGNWYTSAHPRSHFSERLIAARATEHGRLVLVNRELTRRTHDGAATTTTITSAAQLLAVLADDFGIHLPAETRFAIPALAELA